MFLFVILFGLSMDYHVFILSRIREGWDRGIGNDAAVEQGIRGSAGVVTAAAVVMVAVFSIFATLSLIDLQQFGVGLAAAVLIDATADPRRRAAGGDEAPRPLELVHAAQPPPAAGDGRGTGLDRQGLIRSEAWGAGDRRPTPARSPAR